MMKNEIIELTKIGRNFFTEHDHKIVREALPNLSEAERAVVYLRFWTGLCEHEIAQTFDVEEATISSILSGACSRLRSDLLANPAFSRFHQMTQAAS